MAVKGPKQRADNKVNSRVDWRFDLTDIVDVDQNWEKTHQVRVLIISGESPVLDQLAQWKTGEKADYKKIIKVMERVARDERVLDTKHVAPDGAKRDVYEMRAHRGHARVLFFYDSDPRETVICVGTYWKGKGSQNTAFDNAAKWKGLWQQAKPESPLRFGKKGKRK